MGSSSNHPYRIEALGKQHDRMGFSCGVDSLDGYLKTLASQDMRRKANAVFVLVAPEAPQRILGYFTLCATTLEQGAVPAQARKQLPRYPLVSATLIGRLAVAEESQDRGIGSMLLARALRIAYENANVVGASMIVVDAIDDIAARFYETHGLTRLPDSMRLIMPMATIRKLGLAAR